MLRVSLAVLTFLLAMGCARSPIRSPDEAMRKSRAAIDLSDDLGLELLSEALLANIRQLEKSSANTMKFGPQEISRVEYIESLKVLQQSLSQGSDFFYRELQNFEVYEVYGGKEWGEVFVTSYFEPVIQGSVKKTGPYTQPLYEPPKDMVYVDFSAFTRTFPELVAVESVVAEKSRDRFLRGRVIKTDAPVERQILVPYFSREEIDSNPEFKKQAKVICYVDPVDAFFLQIQGSGVVQFADGKEIRLGYAGQNGHSYQAIGRFLFDVIPKEQMSMQSIEQYLRTLSASDRQKLLQLNPSYVFFQLSEANAVTYFGTEAVAGRTIATDTKYFPKGAFGFLIYERPIFEKDENQMERLRFEKSQRFVLDQDTGGAIRGPHRVDLFAGRGVDAGKFSGVMRNPGRLYYFLPKNSGRKQ